MVPVWIRLPSLMVCLMSGVLSIGREAYGIYHGAMPATTLFWRCVWIAFVLSAFTVIGEDWWDRRILSAEIRELKQVPAQFKLRPIQLRRNDPVSKRKRDVFLQVKVELVTPLEILVDGYSMEFSRDGVIETLELGDSVDHWVLYDSSSLIRSESMQSLSNKLRSGRGSEGWIHFLTERTNYELESGRLRFTVHSHRGDANAEVP
jgi:hypothetical protein